MRSKKPRRFLSHPHLPTAVFAAFIIGGCFFIAIAKLILQVNPFLSMTVPILLMVAYLTLSMFTGKLRLHDEQTGDNLYYMGFLYTLTSLGVSLYLFGSDGSTELVVSNFGIAVTSTIAGIALRILYNQMRRDPADIERSARHELADMTRRVRAEMENVTREFADFRRVSNQMLEEGFDEIAKQAERNGEHIRKILDTMAMEAIKPVQEASAKLGEAMQGNFDQIEGQFSAISKKVETAGELLGKANYSMSSSVNRLGEQADAVAAKLERVVVPDEVLKNDLAPMVKALGNAVAQYAVKTETASVEQQSRMIDIDNAVRGIAENTSKAVQVVAENSGKAAAAAEKTAEAVANQQRLTEALVRVVQKQSQDTNELVAELVAKLQPSAAEQAQAAPAEPMRHSWWKSR
ncbi:hypothetical protein RB623_20075 [Mesorhizobium sp. LHD-90]|uniref:hypothetical protein n=1 Tax=Mesorhizobium sp. LHD-90 TaxID=3071414 RepID=UPI0027DFC5E5|nr:hypothetical protein [Mesorhizobium sp. LHD-90]MDQ6436359.1 hypothetical protein [Mesorhizobium sp. LHD-90]